MLTWKRLVRALVGIAAACLGWWLFYVLGVWSGASKSPVTFVCFFFCIVGIDRVLSTLIDLLSFARGSSGQATNRSQTHS
jgi:hypothetical protein